MAAVYASTACLKGHQPLLERIALYREHGITEIELGARVTFEKPFSVSDLPANGSYLIHNYFPAPTDPFILNLASSDPTIRQQSIELTHNAIRLTAAMKAPCYTVHAGFITDPTLKFVFERTPEPGEGAAALERFVATLREVLPVAEKYGVRLLVENNVCTPDHRGQLLCQTPDEFEELFRLLPDECLGILLDTGHLTVSAATFGFDPMIFVARLADRIGALHIHMNDGTADQHRPVTEGIWVLDALRRPDIGRVPWIVEASFEDAASLADHVRYLQQVSAA